LEGFTSIIGNFIMLPGLAMFAASYGGGIAAFLFVTILIFAALWFVFLLIINFISKWIKRK
jgi:preprotein translocase subunit SecG